MSEPIDGDVSLGAFGRAVMQDLREARGLQYASLAVLVLTLGFEWGPGNEVVVVSTIARVIDAQPGGAGIPVVGITGLVLVGLVQLITGTAALVGFAMFERTAHVAWRAVQRLRKGEEPKDWWQMRLSTRWALAFFIGASAVSLVQMTATGRTGWRVHRWVVAQSALLAGLATGFVAIVIAGAAFTARQFPATEPAADVVIAVAGNPLFWICLFVGLSVLGAIRNRLTGASGPTDDPID